MKRKKNAKKKCGKLLQEEALQERDANKQQVDGQHSVVGWVPVDGMNREFGVIKDYKVEQCPQLCMVQQESSIVHADATRVDSGRPEKGGEAELTISCK